MASCGSPRMASAAYRRTSSFSGSVKLSKTSWTSTSGPASAVLIRMPMGRSPSGRTSASRHESRGDSDATTLRGISPSPSTLIVRSPRYSSATSASFTPRLSSSSSASRSTRLARLDASMSRTSVSIGVCTDSADSQIPVSGARASGFGEVMCARGSLNYQGFLGAASGRAHRPFRFDATRSLDALENPPKAVPGQAAGCAIADSICHPQNSSPPDSLSKPGRSSGAVQRGARGGGGGQTGVRASRGVLASRQRRPARSRPEAARTSVPRTSWRWPPKRTRRSRSRWSSRVIFELR